MIEFTHVLGSTTVSWDKGLCVFSASHWIKLQDEDHFTHLGTQFLLEQMMANDEQVHECHLVGQPHNTIYYTLNEACQWLIDNLHVDAIFEQQTLPSADDMRICEPWQTSEERFIVKMAMLKNLQEQMLAELKVIQETKADRVLQDLPF